MIGKWFAGAFLAAALATPACAHARLETQSPRAGETLTTAPAKVSLTFSEELEPSFSGMDVVDADGRSMAAGAAKIGGRNMVLTLKRLAPGRYHVAWHAVSTDAHRTQGGYDFKVQ